MKKLTIKKLKEKYAGILISRQMIKLSHNYFPQKYYIAGVQNSNIKFMAPTLALLDAELSKRFVL